MSDKKYPKISIVTQCFNREHYIGETIESILNQNYPNLEYIVIDDNSTDGSWEVIQKYKDRLTYIEKLSGHRTTPVPALNYGLSKTTGEIMATINDKNIYMPKSLFTIAEAFMAFPDVEWITGIGLLTNKEGMITHVIPVRKDFYEHLNKIRWNIQHESTFWKRSLWERIDQKYDEEYPWAFDVALWRKFFFEAKLYHLNTVVGAYRKISTSHSTMNHDKFFESCMEARREMRQRATKTDLVYAELYRVLRWIKPIVRNIPDGVFAKIPFVNKLCHEAISLQNTTTDTIQFKRYKRNPFRTIFPW